MANYDSTHTGATIDSAVSQVTDSTTDFNVDSNTLVVDKSEDRVGIGTGAPGQALEVGGGGNVYVKIDGSSNSGIMLGDGAGEKWRIDNMVSNDSLRIYADGDNKECMRILQDGKVGIGETAPSTILHLKDSSNTSLTLDSAASGSARVYLDANDAGTEGGELIFQSGGVNKAGIWHHRDGILKFTTGASVGAANTPKMVLDSSGFVGIGTDNPGRPFVINSGQNVVASLESTDPDVYLCLMDDTSTLNSSQRIGVTGDDMHFWTDSTERMRIDSAGDVTFTGDLIMANGKGIDFSATADSSGTMTSEVLDDYEEGTWTVKVAMGDELVEDNASAGAYDFQDGYYTKIGNTVHVWGYFNLNTLGGATGSATIENLPFTVASSDSHGAGTIGWMVNISFADFPMLYAPHNTTECQIREITNAGTTTDLTNANFGNDSKMIFSLSYRV
jgi:hypothetical protein